MFWQRAERPQAAAGPVEHRPGVCIDQLTPAQPTVTRFWRARVPQYKVANGASFQPSISADGRYGAFSSAASNMVGRDTNGVDDIFARSITADTTHLVSVTSEGAQANGRSSEPALSGDGRYVAFRSSASNLVGGRHQRRG